jgi:DNA polymerase-3 subunit alpha
VNCLVNRLVSKPQPLPPVCWVQVPLRLRVPATSLTELKIHQIRKILREHQGESPVYLHIGQGKVLRLADEFCVDLDRVVGELRMALGHDAVIL